MSAKQKLGNIHKLKFWLFEKTTQKCIDFYVLNTISRKSNPRNYCSSVITLNMTMMMCVAYSVTKNQYSDRFIRIVDLSATKKCQFLIWNDLDNLHCCYEYD